MWERIDGSRVPPPPSITAHVDGVEGVNGWYTSDVTVDWELYARDPIVSSSGCDAVTITEDTSSLTITCQAATEGGSSQASVTIRRDTVPPVVTSATRLTPVLPSGWTNEAVVIEFEAEDEVSSIVGPSRVEITVYGEGADQLASHTFTDSAGLTTVAEYTGINIDVTPPSVGFKFANLPDDATPEEQEAERLRWHSEDVVFDIDAIDALSGIDSVVPSQLILSAEGAAVQGMATATDLAGNSTTALSPPVKIDLTPPTIEYLGRTPEPNAYGWNNEDITATWACQDSLSGIVDAVVSETLTAEGEDMSLTGQCVDVAGNITSDTIGGLNLDKTGPEILAVASPPANSAGWNNTDVTVTFTATDDLSGVDGEDSWSIVFTDEGTAHSASHGFTDRAGNSASATVEGINIDKTPPSVACLAEPSQLWPPNRRMIPVTVATTFTDGLSGPATLTITTSESNEPDSGAVPGDPTDDIQGFELGSSSTEGALRAQRTGAGGNRVYTLGYTGLDVADNSATCSTAVIVPHDKGRKTRTRPGWDNRGRGN